MKPSFEVLSTILAIFKLNGVYVPLDAEFPQNRLNVILKETDSKILITSKQLDEITDSLKVEPVIIDQIKDLTSYSTENIALGSAPNSVAYLFFTSGTTGTPKGVIATHQNLIQYTQSAQHKYWLKKDDILASCARYTFSISMFELMFPLSQGAAIRLVPRESIFDISKLANEICKVTVLHMGPSLLRLLLTHIKNTPDYETQFSRLRHLSSGGDMVPAELLTLAREIFPKIEMYVIYGSSEISCMGCTWPVPEDGPIEKTFVGSPFENTQLLVLDDNDHPVKVGQIGNVCFAGPGIVKGYLNNQALNKEKFFCYQENRFYRIGDRGRINKAGNLELLGRADFQIQLHGLRIEPAEVEFYLRQDSSIKEAIVAKRINNNGNEVLVAFCVLEPDKTLIPKSLIEYLREHLPSYMVPSTYIELQTLPLNQNLKVDRNALPENINSAPQQNKLAGTLPFSDFQIAIANEWRKLLGIETIYLEENFFDLGGDSLQAIKMISVLESKLGVDIYGLDIARDSLASIALKYDKTGKSRFSKGTLTKPITKHSDCFYFGINNALYGVYHPPSKPSRNYSVLICPPIGYEYFRCQALLIQISKSLSEQGVPVMYFDYYGTGNSHGLEITANIERWKEDQKSAASELINRSNNSHITVLGVRLGGSLALESFSNSNDVNLVLWDPVFNGKDHIKQTRRTQSKLRLLKAYLAEFAKRPYKIAKNELLDLTFDDQSMEFLRQLNLKQRSNSNLKVILSQEFQSEAHRSKVKNLSTRLLSTDCNWLNSIDIDSAIYNREIKSSILSCINENLDD